MAWVLIPSSKPLATPEKLQMQVHARRYQLNISLGLSLMALLVALIIFGLDIVKERASCHPIDFG
jgi:hypothetical protein